MPGQMDQLAKSMLGPTANANDLYAALGGGKNEATISMDELLDAMVRLDSEGGESFRSFQEQAETAAGGVATAAQNFSNAWTKGIAGTMDAIGKENIAGVFNDMKSAVSDAFGIFNSLVSSAMPAVKGLYDAVKPMAPQLATMAAGFGVVKVAGDGVAGVVGRLASNYKRAKDATGLLSKANTLLGTSFSPVSLAVTGIAAVAGVAISAYAEWAENTENLEEATRGLSEVARDTASLDEFGGRLEGISGKSDTAALSVEDLAEKTADAVERMRSTTDEAESQIATLSSAQSVINQYAGQTDLSAEAQGRLEWAVKQVNDQFSLGITAADVMADTYTDADGAAQDLTDTVNQLVEAKKSEARAAALTSNLSEAYETQRDAARTLAEAQQEYNDKVDWYVRNGENISEERAREMADGTAVGQALRDATSQYQSAAGAVKTLEEELGNVSAASAEAADAFDLFASSKSGSLFEAQLSNAGTSLSMLKDDLRSLGADTERLGALTEDQLGQIAAAYDGTAASVVGALIGLGVGMDEAAKSAALGAADITLALQGMDGDASAALAGVGVDVDSFSQRMAAAGVSTGQLRAVGTENLAALASACSGDIGSMVQAIQNYNETGLFDKETTVYVADGQLVDAQGRVLEWNGTELVPKSTTASVNASSLSSAISLRSQWNSGYLKSFGASASVSVSRVGQSLMASGGIVRHADGFIANRPVAGVHIGGGHVVGEDGAEAVIPLTNKRYVTPFARTVAEQMAELVKPSEDQLTAGDIADAVVSALSGSGLKVYLDGRALVGGIVPAMDRQLGRARKRGELSR